MKDFLGKELNVGDEVVYMRVNYRKLRKGTIKFLGKVKATLADSETQEITLQFHNQLVKI